MKISVLIPTRNRCDLLRYSLETCLRVDDDIEIVISDNFSDDSTKDVALSYGDRRIKYVNTGRRISQRLNFENAIQNSTGDYVFIIGDDDAVLSSPFRYFSDLLFRERPNILSTPSLFYRWPADSARGSGRIKINKRQVYGKELYIGADACLQGIKKFTSQKVDIHPKLYHGFVSRLFLESMKTSTGHYLASGQVDLYFATASLAFTSRYLTVCHPASILAMGPSSGGVSVANQHSCHSNKNLSADIVAEEAATDPVKDPIDGKMPVLRMYLLNGVEQANRFAFDGNLNLDYEIYLTKILDELQCVPQKEFSKGIEQLRTFILEKSRFDLLALLDSCKPEYPKEGQVGIRELPKISSYVTCNKIVLDLTMLQHGNVLAAAQAADYILGPITATMPAHINGWLGALMRALMHIVRGGVGRRPAWGALGTTKFEEAVRRD